MVRDYKNFVVIFITFFPSKFWFWSYLNIGTWYFSHRTGSFGNFLSCKAHEFPRGEFRKISRARMIPRVIIRHNLQMARAWFRQAGRPLLYKPHREHRPTRNSLLAEVRSRMFGQELVAGVFAADLSSDCNPIPGRYRLPALISKIRQLSNGSAYSRSRETPHEFYRLSRARDAVILAFKTVPSRPEEKSVSNETGNSGTNRRGSTWRHP